MSLLDVRKQFIATSGRLNLVVDTVDYIDDGANYYIQNGQKWLERQIEFLPQKGKVFRKLESGKYALTFKDMRTLESVWVASASANSRRKLEYIEYDDLIDLYAQRFASVTNGEPLYWTPMCVRSVNMDSDPDIGGLIDYMDVIEDSSNYNAIVIMPPANQDYHIEIKGKFRLKKLELDADTNYWTDNEPYILMLSAMRALEITTRNTQGVNDWTNAIMAELFGLEKDFVENDTNQITRLEG